MNEYSLEIANDVASRAPKRWVCERARVRKCLLIHNFNFYYRQRFGGEQLTANKLYFYCIFIPPTLLRGIVWKIETQARLDRVKGLLFPRHVCVVNVCVSHAPTSTGIYWTWPK